MKSMLLLTLLALGASAAPLDGSEVEIVQPRRVSTGGGNGGGNGGDTRSVVGFTPTRIDLSGILRSLGLGGRRFGGGFPRLGGRFPVLVARVPSNCDSGRFKLTDEQYDVVTNCQQQREEETLRECIVNGLEDASTDLREFLGRDEYSISGVSVSSSISIVDGEVEFSRVVSFRMCPRDEANAVEGENEAEAGAGEEETGVYRPVRPVFELPDIFGQEESPFDFDFESAFRPFFQEGSSGGRFPVIPDFDIDTDVEERNCVSETFNLPKEAFKTAKSCRYGDEPFKQCLRSALEAVQGAKQLLEFVEDADHQVVDTAFYQSIVAINGQVTRKYRVTLERCLREPETAETPEVSAVDPDDDGTLDEEEEEDEYVRPENPDQQDSYAPEEASAGPEQIDDVIEP